MWRYLRHELPRTVARLLVAFGLYGLLEAIPWPPGAGQQIAVGLFAMLAATVIIICGKLLYDTLYPLQNQYPGRFYPKDRR
jgi:hypothetical protein